MDIDGFFVVIGVFAFIGLVVEMLAALFNKALVKKKYVYWLLGILVVSIIGIKVGTNLDENKVLREKLAWEKKCSTINDVKELIDGTTWSFTQDIGKENMFNMWCKLEFKNDKLYYYEVNPSEGDWGEPRVCDYSIEERRYSNTGERYIGIFWQSSLMKYVFVPSEKSISYQGRNGYVFGAYLQMKDVYPWR